MPCMSNSIQGPVPRKMVKFNPGLSQILSKVFLSKNMQLELTKYCSNDNTKCYSKQCIGRYNTKMEHNFNPGLVLTDFSGTGPWGLGLQVPINSWIAFMVFLCTYIKKTVSKTRQSTT